MLLFEVLTGQKLLLPSSYLTRVSVDFERRKWVQ
jgi:hypothetical protein